MALFEDVATDIKGDDGQWYSSVCTTPLTQQESDEMERVGSSSHVPLLNLRGGSSTVAENCSEK